MDLKAVLAFFIAFLLISGCTSPTSDYVNKTQPKKNNSIKNITEELPKIFLNCSDGTAHGQCSEFKPYYCNDGELVYNATECGCYPYQIFENGTCRSGNACNDSTQHNKCSASKPYYCNDGELSENASFCGCPERYVQENESCRFSSDCSDGTKDGGCSSNEPYFCFNGTLVQKASKCGGCPTGYKQVKESCVDPYPPGIFKTYYWEYRSKSYSVFLGFNLTLAANYASKPRVYTCYGKCPEDWQVEYYKRFVSDAAQQILIRNLTMQANETYLDRKLMLLLRFVQSIPYDYEALTIQKQKYPYETLYFYKGVCSDNSLLGSSIAAQLGYGTALFSYDAENHMALGIKCPLNISNYNSGYCFLEMTTNCSRLTDNNGTYTGGIRLRSMPKVYVMSEGKELAYETAEKEINEIFAFREAEQKLQELEQLMSNAKNGRDYNKYIEEYNSYVKIYNSYVRCE